MYYRDENGDWQEIILEPSGDTLPIGAITEFGGETAPTNWLFCNGQAVSRETYAELFSVIGTTYGDGDGSTTFNVPDFSSRSPMGVGEGTDGTNTETTTLGQEKGEYKHTLTIDEMPSHTHLYRASIGAGNAEGTLNFGSNGSVITGTYGNAIQNAGGSQAHNNMQPVLGVNFIIKAKQSIGIVGTVSEDMTDTNNNAVPNCETVKNYADKVHVLWTNPNPVNGMSEGTEINLSSNNYDMLVWIFCYSNASQNLSTHNMSGCLKGANCHLNSIGYTTGATVRRLLNYSNDTKYISTAAIHSGGSDGTGYCIPLYCLGVKF